MYSLIILGATAFVLSLLLTPIARNLARHWMARAIPPVGSIPIVVAYCLAYAPMLVMKSEASKVMWQSKDFTLSLLPAVVMILFIGLLGDLKGLEPWHKVVGEICVAFLAYWAGVRIQTLGHHQVGGWTMPLTIAWLFICCNSIKTIDIFDGLASGVGLIAVCATLGAAMFEKNFALAVAAVPLFGSMLGFFGYDFFRSSIYLGQSGRLLIGFLLGCYSVQWSQSSPTVLGAVAPLLVFSVPILDTALSMLSRILHRQPLFGGNFSTHIYDRLLSRGYTTRKVTIAFYAWTVLGATSALLILTNRQPLLVLVVCCGAIWTWIQYLGYVEFAAIGRVFARKGFRRRLNSEIALQSYEARLKIASTSSEYWAIVEEGLREFGFYEAHVLIAGSTFHWRSDKPSSYVWEITVPIGGSDCIRLSRAFASGAHSNTYIQFIDLLRRNLTSKREGFVSYACVTDTLQLEVRR